MNGKLPKGTKSDISKKIEISEIKEGVLTIKDKSLRGILMVSSINFSLKSTEEQDAITYRYQDFLNSLDFPIQILIVTRRFDVSDYLAMMEQKRNEQENELLRIQTGEYIEFIRGLSQLTNIMSTFFYVVVPYGQSEKKKDVSFTDRLIGIFKKKPTDQKAKAQSFEEMRAGLWQRLEYISSGLSMCGLKTVTLNNEELLELLYQMYNPEAVEKAKLEELSAPAVPSK